MKVWHPWKLKKNQNPGGRFGAMYQLNSPFGQIFEVNGLDWQCYLAGSSKTAPRILIFSIAIGAGYSFDIKSGFSIAHSFSLHNNFNIASVHEFFHENFWIFPFPVFTCTSLYLIVAGISINFTIFFKSNFWQVFGI